MNIHEQIRAMTRDWIVKTGPAAPRPLADVEYTALASCLEQGNAAGELRNLTRGWIIQRMKGARPSPLTEEEIVLLTDLSPLVRVAVAPPSSPLAMPTDGAPDRERFAAAYRHLEGHL